MEYRKVVDRLKESDGRFEVFVSRGRGSHRMVSHPNVGGFKKSYPLPYHGDKTENPTRDAVRSDSYVRLAT